VATPLVNAVTNLEEVEEVADEVEELHHIVFNEGKAEDMSISKFEA